MIKRIYTIMFILCGSVFMNACLNIEPKGGGYMRTFSYSSEESKYKGTFLNYYDMLESFEYKDSIIYLKLVFNDIFSEITHNKFDSAYAVVDLNGNQYFPQTFIGILDSSNSKIESFKEYEIRAELPTKSVIYKISPDENFIFFSGGESIPFILGKLIMWPPIIGSRNSNYGFSSCTNYGYTKLPDTLKIEVRASYYYKKLCGLEKDKKIVFGEMVFVKRLDTVQREFETAENKRKKKNLFKKNNKVVLVYKSTPQ